MLSRNDGKNSVITFFEGKEEDFPEFEIKLISFLETKDLKEFALENKSIEPKAVAKLNKESLVACYLRPNVMQIL